MALLTAKQERFAINLFKGMEQRQAYVDAGYAVNKPSIIYPNASRLANNSKVLARLEQLRLEVKTAAVMDKQERLERLSEIARAKLTDFMELGQDGSWVNVGPETVKAGAISEIHSRTEYDENGAHSTVHTSVKLHSPMQAIDLLNKMDKLYVEAPTGGPVTNTQINIIVSSDKAKELSEKVAQRLLSGNSNSG